MAPITIMEATMGGKQERLEQWWQAMGEQQRAAARQFKASGQLDPTVLASLESAGLVSRPKPGRPVSLPSDVGIFLKARH